MHSQRYSSFPTTRLRRLRNRDYVRRLVRENNLLPSDLVAPMFLGEGKNIKEVIPSMPGVHRLSIDLAIREIKILSSKGVPAVALFPTVPDRLKSSDGDESYNSDGLVQNAIKKIKEAVPEIGIISDVALDPYTTHGHDGLINEDGDILNDETIDILVRQSISQAEAGIDIIAPSDMMDGRVAAIRAALDARGFQEVK
ncbi:MAG: porphobilinogen synthase, partial [Gammaproteobacteria bacterium]